LVRRIPAFLVAAALAGCVTISSSSIGTFAGVLPCADCSGILTELRLYAEQPSGRAERYELTETYLGSREGDLSIGTTGRWTTVRGSASDRDATVIRIDLGRIDALRNFQRIGDEELRLLDRNLREIVSPARRSLYRVSDLPAATLAESDSGQTIEVEPGQRVFVVLGSNRATGYGWTLDASGPGPLTSLGDPVYARGAAAPGEGGTEIWLFRASGRGKQELNFQYRRASERGASAARTASYTISVR
jgi:copper homeostasis protein (lipoprotein)